MRAVLVPFLSVSGAALGLLLGWLLVQRGWRELRWRRGQRLSARYQPFIDEITQDGGVHVIRRLRLVPASHMPIVSSLLLRPLRTARGDIVAHVREAATALGLVDQWVRDLRDRRWWRRADGLRALGTLEEPSALPGIMSALGDEHAEVRAAAVEAAGMVGDPRAIPALVDHLVDSSRYQRARVIDALRALGAPVTTALVSLARTRPAYAALSAEVLGLIGTPAAGEPLIAWCDDARADVRAAALKALGTIGLDDRSYFYALRALNDPDPDARAMAARALGRGQRRDAAVYLAARLDDEWMPAAQAAGALRRLGPPGLAALEARVGEEGQAGDLARQMLWSRQVPATEAE